MKMASYDYFYGLPTASDPNAYQVYWPYQGSGGDWNVIQLEGGASTSEPDKYLSADGNHEVHPSGLFRLTLDVTGGWPDLGTIRPMPWDPKHPRVNSVDFPYLTAPAYKDVVENLPSGPELMTQYSVVQNLPGSGDDHNNLVQDAQTLLGGSPSDREDAVEKLAEWVNWAASERGTIMKNLEACLPVGLPRRESSQSDDDWYEHTQLVWHLKLVFGFLEADRV